MKTTIKQLTGTQQRLMRLFLLFCFTAGNCVFATGPGRIPCAPDPNQVLRPWVSDEVMVLYKDNSSGTKTAVKTKAIKGKVIKEYRGSGKKMMLRVKLPKGQSVEKAIAENWGLSDSNILRVEPNFHVSALSLPNDPYLSSQWAINNTGQTGGTARCDINASAAWDITTGSYNVIVAVIDTGVDYTHPDLYNQIWVNTDEIPANGIDDDQNGYIDDTIGWDCAANDNNPYDEHGHGTHCAGIIAGQGNNSIGVVGTNWQCQIMPCRFLGSNGSGTIADAIEAVNYAVANGAQILSNSWGGGGYSSTLYAAIENAKNHGVLFVAAAGNAASNNDYTPTYPAGYAVSNVISVAATDHRDMLAYFSCYGASTVHVAAPGVNILSSIPGGYTWMSGTSMATPYVSGAAALLRSVYPDISLMELKNRLIWCGDVIPGLQDRTLTQRRLNVYNSLVAQNMLQVTSPATGTHWVTGCRYNIKWASIGGSALANIYLAQNGQTLETIAENLANEGLYAWTLPARLADGNYTILVDDGSLLAESESVLIDDQRTDYFTEWFSDHTFDLSGKSVMFVPDGSGSYQALAHNITALPTSTEGATLLTLGDDQAMNVTLTEKTVSFYGTAYSSFYVSSNGYITFGLPDAEYRANTANHFAKKRISGLFQDLNPGAGGQVSWKQYSDRVTVTWKNVPRYGFLTALNTFQIELYFNSRIRLSWMNITPVTPVVGLSKAPQSTEDYMASDLSTYNTYEPALSSIGLQGPRSIMEKTTANLSCLGYYECGINRTLGSDAGIAWQTTSAAASVNSNGTLTAGDISSIFQHINISASLNGKVAGLGLCVINSTTGSISLTQRSITAGPKAGYNTITVSGRFTLAANTILKSKAIVVKLWTKQNTCVYNSSFAISKTTYQSNVFNQSKTNGILTDSLKVEPLKTCFTFTAKNVNLSGALYPSYFTIECGGYGYLGILN